MAFRHQDRLLAPMRFLQIFTFERARKRDLAFCSAADRADIAVNGRARAFCAPFAANFAEDRLHQLPSIIGSEQMQRVDLYIKVEVEVEEDEKPEQIAKEICRQLQKIYYVRAAELSNTVARE